MWHSQNSKNIRGNLRGCQQLVIGGGLLRKWTKEFGKNYSVAWLEVVVTHLNIFARTMCWKEWLFSIFKLHLQKTPMIHGRTWINLKNIMQSEKRKTQKGTHRYDSIYIQSKTGKTNLEWQKVDQWLPGARDERMTTCEGEKRNFWGLWKCSIYWLWSWLYRCIHLSKYIKLQLKMSMFYCM